MAGMKKLSIILSSLAQAGLLFGAWAGGPSLLFGAVVALGVSHFYTMEVDFKGVLQVSAHLHLGVYREGAPWPATGEAADPLRGRARRRQSSSSGPPRTAASCLAAGAR